MTLYTLRNLLSTGSPAGTRRSAPARLNYRRLRQPTPLPGARPGYLQRLLWLFGVGGR